MSLMRLSYYKTHLKNSKILIENSLLAFLKKTRNVKFILKIFVFNVYTIIIVLNEINIIKQ